MQHINMMTEILTENLETNTFSFLGLFLPKNPVTVVKMLAEYIVSFLNAIRIESVPVTRTSPSIILCCYKTTVPPESGTKQVKCKFDIEACV